MDSGENGSRRRYDLRGARRPYPWRWIALSTAFHSLLLFGWIAARLPVMPPLRREMLVALPPGPALAREFELPRASSVADRTPGRGQTVLPTPGRVVEPIRRPRPVSPLEPRVTAPVSSEPRLETPPVESVTAVPRESASRIGANLANGRLWVRPLPLPPRELAQRLSGSPTQLSDSAVHVIIQAFLDSAAMEPGADQTKLPSWTKEIGGKKFGIDSRNIYIAGLKIPAAVLALLSLPGGTNQSRAFDRSGQMYDDLRRAATRSATLDEFKQAIRDLRAQKEREHEMQKAQRALPDSQAETTQP
ncbi:MAG: hypothetical protein ABJD11_08570 [Gemmatimonadota bacterium]